MSVDNTVRQYVVDFNRNLLTTVELPGEVSIRVYALQKTALNANIYFK